MQILPVVTTLFMYLHPVHQLLPVHTLMLRTETRNTTDVIVSHLYRYIWPAHQALPDEIQAMSDMPHGVLMVFINRGLRWFHRGRVIAMLVSHLVGARLIECLTEHVEAM